MINPQFITLFRNYISITFNGEHQFETHNNDIHSEF